MVKKTGTAKGGKKTLAKNMIKSAGTEAPPSGKKRN